MRAIQVSNPHTPTIVLLSNQIWSLIGLIFNFGLIHEKFKWLINNYHHPIVTFGVKVEIECELTLRPGQNWSGISQLCSSLVNNIFNFHQQFTIAISSSSPLEHIMPYVFSFLTIIWLSALLPVFAMYCAPGASVYIVNHGMTVKIQSFMLPFLTKMSLFSASSFSLAIAINTFGNNICSYMEGCAEYFPELFVKC